MDIPKIPLNTSRNFGVELEGYSQRDLCHDGRLQGWNFVSDGSLNSSSRGRRCTDCNGRGRASKREYCPHCIGGVFTNPKTQGRRLCLHCNGNGYTSPRCETCKGTGRNPDWLPTYPVECVSNILSMEKEGEKHIDEIFDLIEGYGWKTENDCGTHIHVGSEDLDCDHFKNLAFLMNEIEPILFGHTGRLSNNYTKRMRGGFLSRLTAFSHKKKLSKSELIYAYYDYSKSGFSKYDDARYHGLNLHSYFYRGTTEFRYFGGAKNRDEVKAWIDLCTKVVEFSKNIEFNQLIPILFEIDSNKTFDAKLQIIKEVLGLNHDLILNSHSDYIDALHYKDDFKTLLRQSGEIAI